MVSAQASRPLRAPGSTRAGLALTLIRRLRNPTAVAATLLVGAGLALAAIAGVNGHRDLQQKRTATETAILSDTARQAALNLTTIDVARIDDDVQRIIDASTGPFLDDFRSRAPAFTTFVKTAQSKSIGTVTESAIEDRQGDQARVLVAMSVTSTRSGGPPAPPRTWRMRITTQMVSRDIAKVSNVEFIP